MFKQIAATAALLFPLTAAAWETTRVTPNSYDGMKPARSIRVRADSVTDRSQPLSSYGVGLRQYEKYLPPPALNLSPSVDGGGYEVKTYDW